MRQAVSETIKPDIKKLDEQAPTYSKRAKLYILGLLSSLVFGLLMSLLTSNSGYKKTEKTQTEISIRLKKLKPLILP